ncbi:MAG: methyltransferase [Burkholderiaceae bacterium]
MIHWTENNRAQSTRWHSESSLTAPKRVVIADDTLNADSAYRLACEGTGLLWRGDFQNARQLLTALAHRIDRPAKKPKRIKPGAASPVSTPSSAFHRHRQAQAQRARVLAMLLVPFEADYHIPLRRAPEIALACNEAYGASSGPFVAPLRELLGIIGAHEWRRSGVEIAALGARIHPHYGVFSPLRGEYIDLVAAAPLPSNTKLAFDIGTGSGVLALLLAQRGITRVLATETEPRALSCARENLALLDHAHQIELINCDLFPPGRAPLIVCNPPWLPARPNSTIEHAIYDPESQMLRGFLNGLAAHLEPKGEGWLLLSDLAEHLGLRSRTELEGLIADAGLRVLGRSEVRPQHPKSTDASDALHAARAAELTSLWRLAAI